MAVSSDVYVLAGTGSTVQVFPSALHPSSQPMLLAGPGRRITLRPAMPTTNVRLNDDELVLALLGAL